mgnify:CR=1 FL=1
MELKNILSFKFIQRRVMAMLETLLTKMHGIGVCLSTLKMVAAQERMTLTTFPRPLRKKIMVRSFLTGCFAK